VPVSRCRIAHVTDRALLRCIPPVILRLADESHFGRFTGQYHAGTYLFDIHPPLGKLVFYWVGKLTGYDYTKCRCVLCAV